MSAQPYKGLFICSDFDGTLAVKTKVSQENLDAICEFEEKGGRFTLCTGRFHTILEIEQVPLTLHTPMICLNGAMIYDLAKQQILFEGHTDGTAMLPAVRQLLQEADDLKRVTIMPAGEFRSYHTELPVPTEEILATVGRSLYKMVIVCHKRETEEDTLARSLVLRERLAELLGPGYTVGRSWNVGIEAQDLRFEKGKTARRLSKMLGADELICVGDYENDIPMLREADRSFAVGNAVESAKAVADELLCRAEDHAIADLISRL